MKGLSTVASATACVRKPCCDEEFNKVWDAAASAPLRPMTPKRRRKAAGNMDDYVFVGTTGHRMTKQN